MKRKRAGQDFVTGLRSRTDALLNPPGIGTPAPSPDEYRQLIHDLSDRQILLEERNEFLQGQLEELERSKREAARLLLQPLLQHTEEMVMVIDPAGTLLQINERFAERFHKSRDNLIGTCVWDLFPGETAIRRKGYLGEILRTRKPFRSVDQRDGLWIDSIGVPILDSDGNVASVVVLTRDVTNQKRMEDALQEREQFLQSVLSSIQDGISILDGDMTIVQVNHAMERWYAHAMPLVGKKCWEAYHQRKGPCDPCPTRRTLETGRKDVEIVPLRGATGQTGWLELFSFPLEDISTGKMIGVIEYVRDISARKKAEEEKASLEKEIRRSQKLEAIGTLAGGVAHEFNNLLAAIGGNAELLLQATSNNPATSEEIGQILRTVRRGKQLTGQMLTSIRPEGLDRRPTDLVILFRDALKLVRSALPSYVVTRHNLPDTPAVVLADPTQMQQVLMQLCLNAGHAMRDAPQAILQVDLAEERVGVGRGPEGSDVSPGDYWRLTVSDTGRGMTRQVIERVFDPFFTTKNPGMGTGLGLFAVHGIVRSHGGNITVRSVPGKGSTFSLLFPKYTGSAHVEQEEGPRFTGKPAEGRGKILFVDDEPAIVNWARRAIPLLGFEAECFQNVDQALEAFRSSPSGYDLVVTDLTMPGMSGRELAEEIIKIRMGTPVILCTGFGEVMDPALSCELGIRETLSKPFTMQDLADSIQRVLEQD